MSLLPTINHKIEKRVTKLVIKTLIMIVIFAD